MNFKKILISSIAALSIFGVVSSTAAVTTVSAASDQVAKVQATSENNKIDRVADPDDITVGIQPGVSQQVRQDVKYAIEQWNSTKLIHLRLTNTTDFNDVNITFTNRDPNKSSWGSSLNLIQDTNDPSVKTLLETLISLDPQLRTGQYGNDDLEHTIMHEMGHALGLNDNYADKNAIMYYTSDFYSTNNATVKVNASDYQNLKLLYPTD